MISGNLIGHSMDFSRNFFMGNLLGVFALGTFIFSLLLLIAVYIYHAFAWQKIGKKQNYENNWLAWIPFANLSMILEMGGFNWAWVFLLLIPLLGWIAFFVLMIISMWRIFEKEEYPGWISLSLIIPEIGGVLYLVVIGIVAWYKK